MVASIRSQGVNAPIYISIASRCWERSGDPGIQNAQRALVQLKQGILAGPNTDILGLEYRYDGCHFSGRGLDAVADLWLDALTKHYSAELDMGKS